MSNKTLLNNTFNQLLEEITPQKLIADACRLDGHTLTILGQTYDLDAYKNVYLMGSGKAVVPMALEVEKLIKPFLKSTLLIGPYVTEETFESGTYMQSTHPLPSHKSVDAARALQEMLETMDKDDLFIYLLSGGNSALVEWPEENISLNEFQEATRLMLHSGMPIEKINSVRKHLSQVKGGKLAQKTKAKGIVLVLSDVIGDDLYAIGSAPFYADKTSFKDAMDALNTHGIFEKMPKNIQNFLNEGKAGMHTETPENPSEHIDHHILGSNSIVLQKAQKILQKEGIETTIIDEPIQGDTSQVAEELLQFGAAHKETTHAYIFGGEPTVVVKGEGKGGRNQHLCLHMLMHICKCYDVTFLSAATDGIDGNSNAAGAIVDTHSLVYANAHHIDPQHYLDSFDSNSFFEQTGELLIKGPTHNNLLDIMIMLIEPNPTERETNG
jgi:glycerate-2-kinase